MTTSNPEPVPVKAAVAEITTPAGDAIIISKASAVNKLRDFGLLAVATGLFAMAFAGAWIGSKQVETQKQALEEIAKVQKETLDRTTKTMNERFDKIEREIKLLRSSINKFKKAE